MTKDLQDVLNARVFKQFMPRYHSTPPPTARSGRSRPGRPTNIFTWLFVVAPSFGDDVAAIEPSFDLLKADRRAFFPGSLDRRQSKTVAGPDAASIAKVRSKASLPSHRGFVEACSLGPRRCANATWPCSNLTRSERQQPISRLAISFPPRGKGYSLVENVSGPKCCGSPN